MAIDDQKPDHVEEPTHGADPREAEIGRILNDFLDRRSRGEPVSEVELYEQYPQYADALREHLSLLGLGDGGSGGESGGLFGDSIPGYQILREIHRGGQGAVYQAIQKSTKRRVAIKVMREGPFAGPKDKARFGREVQILGALNHPNIVNIHDSGVASGNHYFVMDYISGQPLDLWMASGQRSIEETLKLFAKICAAVNAAHLKGVVHRDLKPGNIRIDNQGEPHVLDFGLAKMAVCQTTDDSSPQLMTITGQFVGSLPWAAPEQAEGIPNKIDTRTDAYALGVILYQMLTGKFPYEVVGNMRDVLDRIMKAEPARPSTVRRQINDEVETIILKCLSKERERRYQTAGDLARDIARYLSGEPIEAKRDSSIYRIKKRIIHYRVHLTVGLLFAALLAYAVIVSQRGPEAAPFYQCDFSSDPHWETDQPENYYWDKARRGYFVRMENEQPSESTGDKQPPEKKLNRYYFYNLRPPVTGFALTWDLTVEKCDWSAGVEFGVLGLDLVSSSGLGGQGVMATFAHSDGGLLMSLTVSGSDGADHVNSGTTKWELGRNYRCKLSYDPVSQKVLLEVKDKATKGLVWLSPALDVPGRGFGGQLSRLGGSRIGMGASDYKGVDRNASAEALIQNVRLVTGVPKPTEIAR